MAKFRSIYGAYTHLNSIVEDYRKFSENQKAETEKMLSQGYALTDPKQQEMEKNNRIMKDAALRRVEQAKYDFKKFRNELSLPFGIDEQGNITGFSAAELRFLESLKHVKLTEYQAQRYITNYAEHNNTAMVAALTEIAQNTGYTVTGTSTADQDIEAYTAMCNRVTQVIRATAEDTDQAVAETNMQALNHAITESNMYDKSGNPKALDITVSKDVTIIPYSDSAALADMLKAEVETAEILGRDAEEIMLSAAIAERLDAQPEDENQ